MHLYAGHLESGHRLAGELRVGSRLSVDVAPPGGRETTFKPTVLALETDRELRWLGCLLVPGLLDGEHTLRLEALPDERPRLTQAETFRGLLVGLVAGTLTKTRSGFAQMNIALKHRAEAAVT